MEININKYLTKEETETMDAILSRAEKRMRGSRCRPNQRLMIKCQVEQHIHQKGGYVPKGNAEEVLKEICNHCSSLSSCEHHNHKEEHKDEDKPFDEDGCKDSDEEDEIRKAFESGKLFCLFELVNQGKISLEFAAGYAHLSDEDARDYLDGWIRANEM